MSRAHPQGDRALVNGAEVVSAVPASIPCARIGLATLYNADCADVLPHLSGIDLVLTDPPYYKVKGDYWDNEWDEAAHFLDWMRGIVGKLTDCLQANGSLYLFASPQMAARVELVIGNYILDSRTRFG